MKNETNHYDSEFSAITDVQSQPFHNLVVLYGSTQSDEVQALALRATMPVRRTERISDVVTLADGGSAGFGMLQSNGFESLQTIAIDPSRDRLRVDGGRDETLVEWGLAVEEDDVYVGVENPSDVIVEGVQGDRRRGLDAGDLDDHGVLSQLTRTTRNLPTTALSTKPTQGLVRIDSKEDGTNPTRVGFYNDSGGQVSVNVLAHGIAYRVEPVVDTETVRRMALGDGYNRRVLVWGGWENANPNIPRAWRSGIVQLDKSMIRP